MREFAIVKEIKENPSTHEKEIFVLPMIIAACHSCKQGCKKQGKPFKVNNKNGFNLKIGSTVRIGLPKFTMALHGILAFVVPILCSIAGLILSPVIAEWLFTTDFYGSHSEEIQAAGCVIFLLTSALVIFIISRSSIHFSTPEISQIV